MQGAPQANMLVLMVGFIVIFYFFILRPEKKKRKNHEKLLAELEKNDEVVTIGGIHGTIVNVKEKTFILRIDDSARIEIDKTSVAYTTKQRQ